jgi:nuclear GTP-binding protein
MVKFANKSKGRPSKRKSLMVKYKIERKVKQHKKRVRREARKMDGKEFHHKTQNKSDFIPNMFPFKAQLLDQAKRDQPKTREI